MFMKNMYLCRLILNDSRKYGKIQENIARHPQGNSVFRIRDSIYLAIYQKFRQRRHPNDFLFDVFGEQSARMVFHHAFSDGNCCGGSHPCRPCRTSVEIHPLQTALLYDVLLCDGLLFGKSRPAPPRRDSPLLFPPTV